MAYVAYNPTLGMQEKVASPFGDMSYSIPNQLFTGNYWQSVPELGDNPTPEQQAAYDSAMAANNAMMGGQLPAELQTKLNQELAVRDASAAYNQMGKLGLNYSNQGLSSEQNRETIAARLAEYGVTDLGQLGFAMGQDGKQVFYNKATGKQLPSEIGYTTAGEGMQKYNLQVMPNGQVVPTAQWQNTSDMGTIAPLAALAMGIAAPWAVGALGGGLLAGAGVGGLTGAAMSGLTGGNILKGGLTGAALGGLASSLSGFKPTDSSILNSAIKGGITGATGAGVRGGDILQGALAGSVNAGANSAINTGLSGMFGNTPSGTTSPIGGTKMGDGVDMTGFYSDPFSGGTDIGGLGSGTYGQDALAGMLGGAAFDPMSGFQTDVWGGSGAELGSGISGLFGGGTDLGSIFGGGTSSGGGLNLNLGNIMNLLAGGTGVASGINAINQGNKLAGQADPFGPYRSYYAGQLGNLMNNPSSITSTPGYQFLQQQGLEGVSRQMASRGYATSGNEMLALQQQGQGLANQQYQQQLGNLMTLSGASQSPASGVGAAAGALGSVGQAGWGALAQGMGTLGQTAQSWWNTGA